MTEVFVPGKEEKKEEKKTAEPDEKNNRDSQVIKEAINKAIKEQNKDAKQDLWKNNKCLSKFIHKVDNLTCSKIGNINIKKNTFCLCKIYY